MLKELHIRNVAVIEEVTVEFSGGFNVLTGETGAGKSILIDSINLALGGKTNKDLIRGGADFAAVDAVFEVAPELTPSLEDLGIEVEEDQMVLISRKLSAEGKSTCRINGRPAPLAVVKEVGTLLITIHGQNDNQALLSAKTHIHLLDAYGRTESLLNAYKKRYTVVRDLQKKLDNLSTDESEKMRKMDLLRFQIDEIKSAGLKPGEEEELSSRRDFLANVEKIVSGANEAYTSLYGDDYNKSAYDLVTESARSLEEISEYDESLKTFYSTLSSVMADLEDVTHELKNYMDGIDYEQGELDEAEERLGMIYNLERKYGNSIEEILKYYDKIVMEVQTIEHSDELIEELTLELKNETKKMEESAKELSKARLAAARELEQKIMQELSELDMQKVRFSVSVQQHEDSPGNILYDPTGFDRVEFLISSNPGEALKPLSKIASGGEMSRIMLAIKSILADTDVVETLIFDEIDTGVSGRAAQKIAEKISALSHARQILCITHLAQIASMADAHYRIEKHIENEKTATTVTELEETDRVDELARIIGGVRVTELTIENAKEMLDLAASLKGR